MAVTGQVQAKVQTDDGYIYRYDNTGGSPTYEGAAEPGSSTSSAVWRIKKFTYDTDGAITTILYAGGKKDFATVWTARADASYS